MKTLKTFLLIAALGTIAIAANATAPTLKTIMQGLGTAMTSMNTGIINADFKAIEQAASKIADHPKPKSQLPIVSKTLKERMPKFKKFDSIVHNAATDIMALAKNKDLDGILQKNTVMLKNCVACHSQFRSEISKALSLKSF